MSDRANMIELTNLCMVYDDNDNILVLDRLAGDWAGVTFPGGHVEEGEAIMDSVIREVKEETGLDIKAPKLCGLKQWQNTDGSRYLVVFCKTNQFSGKLQSSDEGEVFWIKRNELKSYKLSQDFEDMIKIFEDDSLSEFYYYKENDKWEYRLL